MNLEVKRINDIVGRQGTLLTNGLIRVVVEDFGGMTPELSYKNEKTYVNMHFVPHFRGSSSHYDENKHKAWGAKLAHELAGTWPCFPNFGNSSFERGYEVPVCGHTAQGVWDILEYGANEEFCYQVAALGGKHTENIYYKKYDILLKEESVYYQVIKIKNNRDEIFNFGGALHNTTGSSFIEKGCKIAASADLYHTPPVSHDPNQIERLKLNVSFSKLNNAPLNGGGSVDLTTVPGLVGYTDFITGRIPQDADLGWMGIINPNLGSIYLTFFKGPKTIAPNEFTFLFNHLWLQYGGRNYLPWAKFEGGFDQTLAVGIESGISAWGYGLDYCDKNPVLMGNPTIIPLLPNEEKTLFHGTLVRKLEGNELNLGIKNVNRKMNVLEILSEDNKIVTIPADSFFEKIQKIVDEIDNIK